MSKIDAIKAANRSLEILHSVGVTERHFNGKNQPCPGCGGSNRFQWNKRKGLFVCRHYDFKYHDFITLVAHVKFCDNIKDAIDYCMDYLGLNNLSDREKELMRIRQEAAMIKRNQQEQIELAMDAKKKQEAKLIAQDKWRKAKPVTSHPYLTAKQVSGQFIRQADGALMIPIYNNKKELVNLQRIYANGGKFFITNAEIVGCFGVLGSLKQAKKVFICEGFATGMSLYQAYKLPVLVAFTAGNLVKVAASAHDLYPAVDIIVCADNDIHSDESILNAGLYYAKEAAKTINAKVLIPILNGKIDFNDLMNLEGYNNLIYQDNGNEIMVTRLPIAQAISA